MLFGSYYFLLLLRLFELILRLLELFSEDGLGQRPGLHVVVVKVDRLGMQERVRVHLSLLYECLRAAAATDRILGVWGGARVQLLQVLTT